MSIANMLRREIDATGSIRAVSLAVGLNPQTLWPFFAKGSDLKLTTAEALLRRFGYCVVREADARAAGIELTTPVAVQGLQRKARKPIAARRTAAKPTAKTPTRATKGASKRR